jgi:hypothetical protein
MDPTGGKLFVDTLQITLAAVYLLVSTFVVRGVLPRKCCETVGGGGMRNILAPLAIAATLSLSSAQAGTLFVQWVESDAGINASWEQNSAPTPNSFESGVSTDVPVWNFTSTGTTSVGPYSRIVWYNAGDLGLFDTPGGAFSLFGPQAYTGPESTPQFLTGVYQATNVAATVTISSIPEPSTWAMMGLGFAGLAFAGFRTRRSAVAAA